MLKKVMFVYMCICVCLCIYLSALNSSFLDYYLRNIFLIIVKNFWLYSQLLGKSYFICNFIRQLS